MNTLIKTGIVLLLTCFFANNAFTQPNQSYKFLEEKDNVKIYYKWKKKFPYGQNVQRNLILYIDNNNDENVAVNFSVDIFVNAVRHSSSGILNYCLPSDYEITGRFKNLAFDTGLSWNELNSDSIMWEINSLKVEKYDGDCKTQSNWLKTSK